MSTYAVTNPATGEVVATDPTATDAEIADAIVEANKVDLRGMTFGANPDQDSTLAFDVRLLKAHPALKARTKIGGFLYDVDNGSLVQVH